MRYTFYLLVFTFLSFTIYAQQFTIKGRLLSDKTPIENATVYIGSTSKGVLSEKDGSFMITGIPLGKQQLLITRKGFMNYETEIISNAEGVIDLKDIHLLYDYLQLNSLVVTATRNNILRKDAPIVCNVLDKKIIDATQSVTLLEGLSFQPALRIENNCQNCGFSGLRMNGLESAYNQVLVDGRPIFNSLQGVYGLEQIPANLIERIEIIKSGGSALYGSSAVAGTVNIITKEPEVSDFYLNTNQALINGQSPDRSYMVGSNIITKQKNAGLSINAFHRNRKGWDMNGDGFSEIGKLQSSTIGLKTYIKPTDLSKITVNSYYIYEMRRGGNKFELPYHEADITEATTHNISNGGVTYEQYSKSKLSKFSVYTTIQLLKRDSYYGSGKDPNAYGNSQDKNFIGGLQYSGRLGMALAGHHTIVSGIEYNYDNLQDNAPSYKRFIKQTAKQTGIYLQDLYELTNKLNILIGARFDHHNFLAKPVISPRFNLLYKMNTDWQFRVGYAKGFRAPQVFDEDLHITQVGGKGTVISNAKNLNPEYSNAYTASLDFNKYYTDWATGFSIDGFYTRLTDVFILEELGKNNAGDLLIERRNGSGAKVLGITFNPKLSYKNKFDVQLGFTIQKSEYDSAVQWSKTVANTDKSFFRTPNKYGFYVFTWNISKTWGVNLSGVYSGTMKAPHFEGYINSDRLEKTPAFFENNFKADYNIALLKNYTCTISAGIQNYLNSFQKDFDKGEKRDAAYIYGPSRPRTFFMGVKFAF